MGLLDILSTPVAPSPAGCAKKKQNEPVPENLVQYSSADMIAVLDKYYSSATICNIREITFNAALGATEEERVNNFAKSAAEFAVNVKYAPTHQTGPADDPQIKKDIAGLKNNQKEWLISALSALIVGKMKQNVSTAGSPDMIVDRMINFTYATNGLREDFRNWCPTAAAPSPQNVSSLNNDKVPLPEPLTMYTKDELKGLIAQAQKVPPQECVMTDKDSMVKALKAMDEAARNAIIEEVVDLNPPHYSTCSVSPAAVNSSAKEQELVLTLKGEPLNLFDDEGELYSDYNGKELTLDFGEGIGAFPASLAKDNSSLVATVKFPAGLTAGNKLTITVKLGDEEIGELKDGLLIKAKRSGGGGGHHVGTTAPAADDFGAAPKL